MTGVQTCALPISNPYRTFRFWLYSETLRGSMGGGRRGSVWCEYTKATGGTESWSPKFFYIGCRYLQIHLAPATTNGALPKIKSVAGVVIQSSSEPVGEFACSNPLFNRIRTLVRWAQRSNMVTLLTD